MDPIPGLEIGKLLKNKYPVSGSENYSLFPILQITREKLNDTATNWIHSKITQNRKAMIFHDQYFSWSQHNGNEDSHHMPIREYASKI